MLLFIGLYLIKRQKKVNKDKVENIKFIFNIFRDDREEYPSDMIREDCEIYPGRLKQRIQMKERDDYRNRVDYTDKDIRIRSGIRSSMSRPEKGIKIQVSPNK